MIIPTRPLRSGEPTGQTTPNTPAASPPVAPAAEPPPASKIVVEGKKSEREVELETQLESERAARRTAETRAAEVEDKHERYRKAVETPAPKKKRVGVGWFEEEGDE